MTTIRRLRALALALPLGAALLACERAPVDAAPPAQGASATDANPYADAAQARWQQLDERFALAAKRLDEGAQDASDELAQAHARLEEKRRLAAERLAELQHASKERWDELQAQTKQAFDELEHELEQLVGRLDEPR